jgi:hypothetical protein
VKANHFSLDLRTFWLEGKKEGRKKIAETNA